MSAAHPPAAGCEFLPAELPEQIALRVLEDALAAKLAARVLHWLPAAGYAQLSLFERAAFRLRLRGNFLAAPAYLLRLTFSPTEEDWQADGKITSNPVLGALRRPFRLARKYIRRMTNHSCAASVGVASLNLNSLSG